MKMGPVVAFTNAITIESQASPTSALPIRPVAQVGSGDPIREVLHESLHGSDAMEGSTRFLFIHSVFYCPANEGGRRLQDLKGFIGRNEDFGDLFRHANYISFRHRGLHGEVHRCRLRTENVDAKIDAIAADSAF
jgi:hypothetical protein